MFLRQLADWESALDEEEAALKKEIAKYEEAKEHKDLYEDPPKCD